MKKVLLIAACGLFSTIAMAEGRNDAKTEIPTKSEAKTQALLYWFDANTGQYIGRSENSGCDRSTPELCAEGYANVANPSNPTQPSGTPDDTDTGKH